MSDWQPVIGLEVHAHLKTRTKMFCRCELDYGAHENSRTCPVCLAHPGALPVPNERAIELTIKLGLALECAIAKRAVFARKNYFYPDLPKGYQISQYESPLCGRGRLVIPTEDGEEIVGIVRAHLEEDAAKTVHAGGATGRSVGATASLVDFNRSGTPLLEIVSEPDMHSADEALRYMRLLRQTIVELGVSDAEMEKGTLRADVNVSVRRRGEDGLRPRWEIKNMNSFTFIGRAIEAAVRQQVAAHEAGEEVVQSTYDYDADTDRLTVHRSKEEADDYRYFPEPDLVPVEPPAEMVERLGGALPELPGARIRRLEPLVGFPLASELVSTGNERKAELLAAAGVEWRAAANVAMNRGDFLPENAPALAAVLGANLTREALDRAFAAAATASITADDYLSDAAVGDEAALAPLVDAVLAANPGQVETYRGGKEGVLGFFVGQVMKETGGKADPKVVNRLLRERLAR
ncbi:MAG: Asp-tRNA(Asn)/Glu-tRNA(Gln) amidotransferase subunit GatB [Acidobacteriota bacterium]|nr:Asp-tRNA(Asn)/Glu-tRNA(Gln) amidotransferase subunit GatB [Acidobacteriota bacterium]MDE3191119.1 Asp-tRNA(Asn)/Glu-tRNA(Gln) amidotransferase subunit GatB [Acidobacteriota bacterium]